VINRLNAGRTNPLRLNTRKYAGFANKGSRIARITTGVLT